MRSRPSAAWWGRRCPTRRLRARFRGDLGISGLRNLIHASDSAETAAFELDLWFGSDRLVAYSRDVDAWIVAQEPKG